MFLLLYSICILFPIALVAYYYKSSALPQMDKYVQKASIWILLLDYLTKLTAAILLEDESIDEETFGLIVMYVPIVDCGLIYLCNKFIGPQIDKRKIKKEIFQHKWSIRQILFYALLFLCPLYTIEIYLLACGFDGISNYYQVVSSLDDSIDWQTRRDIDNFSLGMTYVLFIYVLLAIIFFVMVVKRQCVKQKGISIANLESKNPPILFLRSFELNKSMVSSKTFDEHLCSNFSIKTQPIISLADPDVAFADGSVKLQAEDNSWKEAIVKLFEKSKAVIMFEGKSDGLNWEIDNIKKYIPYNRFFIATPPDDYRIVAWVTGDSFFSTSLKIQVWWAHHFTKKSINYAYNFIWKHFSERLALSGIHLPEQQPGSGCLFSFDETWNVKNVYSGLIRDDFFYKVLSLIPHTNYENMDYSILQKSVEEYEVKGQITQELEKKCKKFANVISAIQVALFVMIVFIISSNL